MKSFSEACERNKQPILSVIKPLLKNKTDLLEIGTGTGQHAIYFAKHMPWLKWQTSDRQENHAEICERLDDYEGNNLRHPIDLDVQHSVWPKANFNAVYSSNTTHIMAWEAVTFFFKGAGNILSKGGIFILYGPFNYDGEFTCKSNEKFEGWLKSVDPCRGIRDFEALDHLANEASMTLVDDIDMPANNRILVWKKG